MMEDARNILNVIFMEFFIIRAWKIWKQKKNNLIFQRSQPSFTDWKIIFIEEATLQANESIY
jgi:hypothetical protein